MMEGLRCTSNIMTQTCCPLCGHKKLNKLDDSKRGIEIKVEKYAKKQVGDQKVF